MREQQRIQTHGYKRWYEQMMFISLSLKKICIQPPLKLREQHRKMGKKNVRVRRCEEEQ